MTDTVVITERWCITEDRVRVVPETDPAARWLHWTPGMEVDREEAERLGAIQPEAKQLPPPANKQRGRPPTKGR